MNTVQTKPGPVAAQAFRLGIVASAAVGLAGIAILYWSDAVSLLFAGYMLVALFPVYLIFAAAVLSVWLGYNKDVSSLRPVYRQNDSAGRQK